MKWKLFVRSRFLTQLMKEADWYEAGEEGIGDEFLDTIQGLINRIEDNPLQFPKVSAAARVAITRRFPFNVYFRVHESDSRIEILLLASQHRDPSLWKKELKDEDEILE